MFLSLTLLAVSTTFSFKLPPNTEESPSSSASISLAFPDTDGLHSFILTSKEPSVKTISAAQADSLPNPDGFLTSFLAQFEDVPGKISLPAALDPATYKVHSLSF